MNLKILIVDDERLIREEIRTFLERKKFEVYEAERDDKAFEILSKTEIDIIILDIKMPGSDGIEILKKVKNKYPAIEVIMMTGHGDSEVILEALRGGAFDFFHKPISLFDIQNTIEKTSKFIELNKKLNQTEYKFEILNNEVKKNWEFELIGKSDSIKRVYNLISKAASNPDTYVLITGPSGSGKELIARTIHYSSERRNNYFYPLNCSAIPGQLIESEIFGHKKGAFTGAVENKKGCFEAADKGTLFMDEIGDMPINAQAKLLRVLEDKKIKKIGSNTEIPVNVRIISATNKNLKELIKQKKFRKDLYYRLNILEIKAPSLHERKEDIPLLIEYYNKYFTRKLNKKIKSIDNEAISVLMQYDFPGNIRELKNIIERAIILCDTENILPEHFLLSQNRSLNESELNSCVNIDSKNKFDLELIEKETINKVLRKTNNNKSQAAKLLNISRYSLLRKIKKYSPLNVHNHT